MIDSIVSAVRDNAELRPDRVAVIADDEQITYAELWREVQGFAAYIRSLGLGKGSRIIVKSGQSIWFAVSAFAIHLSGNVHVPIEKSIGARGLEDIVHQLQPAMVISDAPLDIGLPCVAQADVRELARAHYRPGMEFDFPTPDMISELMFTTGTTGKSKGVVLSHRAMVAATENQQYGVQIEDDNVYLIPAPLNHVFALRKLYVCILTGTTAVLMDGYMNIKRFFGCISKYGVNAIALPPSAVRMLLVLAADELAKYSGQLKHIHTGGSMYPQADRDRLCELMPKSRLFVGYGSSEAGSACMYDYNRYRHMVNCVGKPNRNARVIVVDDQRNEIRSSKENQGLIAIGGPIVMEGYYNEPELTASVLKDGFLYTNDIGYIDGDGFVYVLGRRDDVITVGGLKIAPTEVENVVLEYPGVSECVCYAVQDRMGGSVPKLNLVPEPGAKIDQKALRVYLAQHLEAFKIPKLMEIVDEIPKTANGKINRKALK